MERSHHGGRSRQGEHRDEPAERGRQVDALRRKMLDKALDDGLEDTFPASDHGFRYAARAQLLRQE